MCVCWHLLHRALPRTNRLGLEAFAREGIFRRGEVSGEQMFVVCSCVRLHQADCKAQSPTEAQSPKDRRVGVGFLVRLGGGQCTPPHHLEVYGTLSSLARFGTHDGCLLAVFLLLIFAETLQKHIWVVCEKCPSENSYQYYNNFTTVGDANVSVTEAGVGGWAWWAWSTHA